MNSAYLYLQLYRLFDSITPVRTDCGGLCDKACCRGDDGGMYLFPGECLYFIQKMCYNYFEIQTHKDSPIQKGR